MKKSAAVCVRAALLLVAVIFYGPPRVCGQGIDGPPPPDAPVDAAARAEVIDQLLKKLNDSYVFSETAKRMETAVRERAARKEYDQFTTAQAFAAALTKHLQEVSKDKHLRVRYSHQPIPARQQRSEPSAQERENSKRFGQWVNYGFEKVERLPGNVGYIDFRGFMDPEAGADTVAAAMNFLANTNSIIFDLRQNGGGSPAMVALITSYLYGPEPVHLNSLYWREGERTEEFWTHKTVAGKRHEGKDVYVLTSNYTFSGAEEFAYNLKNLKRATIIGETTGGGAHPGGFARLTDHFGAFIPTGRAINPITKTNWEGTGVKPDVEVPAAHALKTAHLQAARKALDKAVDEQMKRNINSLINDLQKELDELKKSGKASAAASGK